MFQGFYNIGYELKHFALGLHLIDNKYLAEEEN